MFFVITLTCSLSLTVFNTSYVGDKLHGSSSSVVSCYHFALDNIRLGMPTTCCCCHIMGYL